jgi:hypothetical protein
MKFSPTSKLGPRSLEAQLDLLLISRWMASGWAEPIWSRAELPVRLQHCVRKLARGVVWRAYRDATQIYFAIGRVASIDAGSANPASLEAHFLDAEGTVLGGGVWSYDRNIGFQLQKDLDVREIPATVLSSHRYLAPSMPELALGRDRGSEG